MLIGGGAERAFSALALLMALLAGLHVLLVGSASMRAFRTALVSLFACLFVLLVSATA
jgi:hypothetical protein